MAFGYILFCQGIYNKKEGVEKSRQAGTFSAYSFGEEEQAARLLLQ